MKRAIVPALMISLLLSACAGGTAVETALEARRDVLAAAAEISFAADMTAFPGGEVFACSLACHATPEEVSMEVTAPELAAGVRAAVQSGETTLRYADVMLSVGGLDAGTVSPFSAVPLLVRALREGHIIRAWEEAGEEAPLLAADIYADDTLELTVWFDAASLAPVSARICASGAEKLRCEIREFSYT